MIYRSMLCLTLFILLLSAGITPSAPFHDEPLPPYESSPETEIDSLERIMPNPETDPDAYFAWKAEYAAA